MKYPGVLSTCSIRSCVMSHQDHNASVCRFPQHCDCEVHLKRHMWLIMQLGIRKHMAGCSIRLTWPNLWTCKAIMSNADCRCSENALLSLLSILTTASQFRGPGKASQPTQDWMPAFQKSTAAVEGLLQRLQSQCTSKTKDVHQDGTDVCQLAHAALSAISVLRKRLHSVATGNLSGAATGELFLAVRTMIFKKINILIVSTENR